MMLSANNATERDWAVVVSLVVQLPGGGGLQFVMTLTLSFTPQPSFLQKLLFGFVVASCKITIYLLAATNIVVRLGWIELDFTFIMWVAF